MKRRMKALVGSCALIGLLTYGSTADALTTITVDKCLSGKLKAEGKGAAGYLGCHAKGASQNSGTDGGCLAKAGTKMVTAFAKLDGKGGCGLPGDGPAGDADTSNHAADRRRDGWSRRQMRRCQDQAGRQIRFRIDELSCEGGFDEPGIAQPGMPLQGREQAHQRCRQGGRQASLSDLGQGPGLLAFLGRRLHPRPAVSLESRSGPGCLAATPTPTYPPTTTRDDRDALP